VMSVNISQVSNMSIKTWVFLLASNWICLIVDFFQLFISLMEWLIIMHITLFYDSVMSWASKLSLPLICNTFIVWKSIYLHQIESLSFVVLVKW
jgi:hypothetical protein